METEVVANLMLAGTLFVAAFVGFAKGFLAQVIELVGAVATFIIAILLSGQVAEFLASRFDAPYSVWLVVGFLLLIVGGLALTHLLALALGRVVKMTILQMVDRFTGAALGLIMGMIVASLLIALTLELPFPHQFRRDVAKSSMSLFLRPIAGRVFNWVLERSSKDVQFRDIFKENNTV